MMGVLFAIAGFTVGCLVGILIGIWAAQGAK
jgi:hypothetical protein